MLRGIDEGQRLGYGQQQLRHLLSYLAEHGFTTAVVRTNGHPFFGPARRAYRAVGFREVGREPGTLSVPFDTLVFERPLTLGAA